MAEYNDVLRLIREQMPTMSKSQRKIAEYIVDKYEQAVFMTAAQLGEALDFSRHSLTA